MFRHMDTHSAGTHRDGPGKCTRANTQIHTDTCIGVHLHTQAHTTLLLHLSSALSPTLSSPLFLPPPATMASTPVQAGAGPFREWQGAVGRSGVASVALGCNNPLQSISDRQFPINVCYMGDSSIFHGKEAVTPRTLVVGLVAESSALRDTHGQPAMQKLCDSWAQLSECPPGVGLLAGCRECRSRATGELAGKAQTLD